MNQVDVNNLPLTSEGFRRERSPIGHSPMTGGGVRTCAVGFIASVVSLLAYCPDSHAADNAYERHVGVVTETPGLVAFWDFVRREPEGARRFVAHVPPHSENEFALDANNYVRDYWGTGRKATYDDFPLLGRGPFGQAIQIRRESDPSFRPLLMVPRERLHDSSIDIKGEDRPVSVVVWAIRESGNHNLAGIWHEGTDLKERSTKNIQHAVRGQRQYAVFAGLERSGSSCGHVSENGAGSFQYKYAMHKTYSQERSPEVPADSDREVLDQSWQCFAMTFDPEKEELKSWLGGEAERRWQDNIKQAIPQVYNAWLQAELHSVPGLQKGEDESYPHDQFYHPPEDKLVSSDTVSESAKRRVELKQFEYTRVRVTSELQGDGSWKVVDRDLVAVCKNPWWFPHPIYSPADSRSGGPFTIGRAIHSARSVGFTGWIGGVAVFDRALGASELKTLAEIPVIDSAQL
ncbi:LamG domain-containing protein [Rhodopirellula sallentina]|uniref:Uncharacterized protein n=1 Tax=Rhodopirellula sallentina SM41 TaxID=1263870 RepID=M5U167_9BACT|nr:hypothetical protein [Rhodopirellula sallentina]EMI55024.1 hypothetical protein RSSM_03535 [Rhodopirellula sallentina SM41]